MRVPRDHRVWPGTLYPFKPGECRWCGTAIYRLHATFCDGLCQREYDLRADPKLMRRHVFYRDAGVCQNTECGRIFKYFTEPGWQADHIKPLYRAHGDWTFWDPANVQMLCLPCHKQKTRRDLRSPRRRRRARR